MEGFDFARFADWRQTLWPTEKSLDGVSQKVLTAQLRQMEQNGLLTRTAYPEAPPRVEYALTELGYSLKPVLDAMADWGAAYKAQNAYVCRP